MASAPLLFDVQGIDYERYSVSLADPAGTLLARNEFEWRTGTLLFEEELKHVEELALRPKQGDTFHITFGQRLYKALLGGDIGSTYTQYQSAQSGPCPIIMRIDPQTAQPLARLPWELMHDGNTFISLNPRTPMARLPFGASLRSSSLIQTRSNYW